MKAYRRRGRKFRKSGVAKVLYPNLLRENFPKGTNDIWVADFTYIPYRGKFLYLATVMDLFAREIVGVAVMANHSVPLVLQALFAGVEHHSRANVFHSDNGREYGSKVFIRALT